MDQNDAIRQMLEVSPLMAFSVYTVSQVDALHRVATEIKLLSEPWGDVGPITDFQRVYGLFWLWVLGSYEVARTMDQNAMRCFSEGARARTAKMKRRLAEIRMPFAKQQLRGSNIPVYSEPSVAGIKGGGMIFHIGSEIFNSIEIIHEFESFIESITPRDIVAELPVRRIGEPWTREEE